MARRYYLGMGRSRSPVSVACLLLASSLVCATGRVGAQTDEIQVYTGALESPGRLNLTVHTNYTPLGRTVAGFSGGVVPQGSTNGALEWAYGVSDWLEGGVYFPVYTMMRGGKLRLAGAKLRALVAVPRADSRRFFYGVNFEFSRNSRAWDESRYGGEIRPIVGARSGAWDFIVNPILDTSFDGLSRLDFAPSARVARNRGAQWAGALEYYADFGEIRHLVGGAHTVFAVADHSDKFLDIEAGVGFGITRAADRIVLKTIVSHTF